MTELQKWTCNAILFIYFLFYWIIWLIIADCFITLSHIASECTITSLPFPVSRHITEGEKNVIERKYRMFYRQLKKHVRAKPGGAALTNILSCSSIRPLFSLCQDEPGKYPAWQIWILLILIHALELTIALLVESISPRQAVNTVWHHLLVKIMPCQRWFAWWFFPVMRITNTVKHQLPCCHRGVTAAAHHPQWSSGWGVTTNTSWQCPIRSIINCSWKEEKKEEEEPE